MRTYSGLGFDPAPGSVAEVEAVLSRLADALAVLDGSAGDLHRAVRQGGWTGPAAAAFRAAAGGLPAGLAGVSAALRATARTLSTWQSRLAANQREAELLDLVARRLRAEPASGRPVVAEELARLLDRARRLEARHLRQADDAARAVRSLTGAVATAGWPEGSADLAAQWSDRVTTWSGGVALGLATPAWPGGPAPAGPGVPGDPAPNPPGTPLLGEAPRDATASAGLLDTGSAPAYRLPLDRLPDHPLTRLLDAAPAIGPADRVAVTGPHHRSGPGRRLARDGGSSRRSDPPGRTGEPPHRERHVPSELLVGDTYRRDEADPRASPAEVAGEVLPASPVAPEIPAAPATTPAQPAPAAAAPATPDPGQPDRTVEQRAAPPSPEARQAPVVDQPAERPAPRAPAPEPGRFAMADPGVRPAPVAGQPTAGPVKERDDRDLVGLVVGPGPGGDRTQPGPRGQLRIYLLRRPGARPIVAIFGGSRSEPLLVTGLPPCARTLPDCAAPLPANGGTTVY
ncbi:hypothetical protein [Actinophytocola sp.]|uniref:hypothetical protein n=1 Tax=Actinophytocola sp. TaxID=1872138 RepID=UPI002ED788B4